MNKNILIVLIVLVAAGLIWLLAVNTGDQPNGNENGNGQNINFFQEGNIVRNNPGLTPNTWYLIYDQAGSPGVTQELNLEDSDNIRPGQRVSVEGVLDGQVVDVVDLEILNASKDDLIWVANPLPDESIASPLVVEGEARGTWYFEADFPVKLLDAAGNVIAQAPAAAQSEWMTEEYVPFTATLNFTAPTSGTGTLVLEKSNPSGLPENADELSIPVRFGDSQSQTRTIQLYYYDPSKDQDASGNTMCTQAGLVAVDREIPVTQTPIQDTIRLLLRGELTDAEEAQGITTEYPLSGFALQGANLQNGMLTLEFSDPQNQTVGGACRVGVLWFQVEATAKQFPGVNEVQFKPEELFQP